MADFDAIVDDYVKLTASAFTVNASPGTSWILAREMTDDNDVEVVLMLNEPRDPSLPTRIPMKYRRNQKDLRIKPADEPELNLLLALPHGEKMMELIATVAREW